ncbi:MAG: hypothetical protein HC913_00785 [Microscillaceae bacterium]|nr:hypothetical protein [Microscillaceae bacterium]
MTEDSPEIIYQNEKNTSRLEWRATESLYLLYGEGHVNLEDFKGSFNALKTHQRQSGALKVIIDIYKVKSTPILGRTWLVSSFLPDLYKNLEGSLAIALINTNSFFEGLTISLLVKTIQGLGFDLGIRFYKDVVEAEAALRGEKK